MEVNYPFTGSGLRHGLAEKLQGYTRCTAALGKAFAVFGLFVGAGNALNPGHRLAAAGGVLVVQSDLVIIPIHFICAENRARGVVLQVDLLLPRLASA